MTTGDVRSTYKFVVLDVQEDEFRPEVGTFGSLDDLGDVDTGDEELQMLHDWGIASVSYSSRTIRVTRTLLWPVLAV